MAWWDSLAFYRRISIVSGAVAAVIAALFAVANAMNAGEPYWIATRGYTRYTVADALNKAQVAQHKTIREIQNSEKQIQRQQIRTEIQVVTGRIEDLKSKISDRKILLQQPGPEPLKRLVRDQIDQFETQLARLSHELDLLYGRLNTIP